MLTNTVITQQQLRATPSLLKGFSPQKESQIRMLLCELIQQAAILLKLPQVAAATSQVLLHRLLFMVSISSMAPLDLVGGVMYLSCYESYLSTKLEESPRNLRSIIGVLSYLARTRNKLPFLPIDVSSPVYCQFYSRNILKAGKVF